MVPHFQTLEVLQEHGIAANDIQKLQTAGYHTVESVSQSYNLYPRVGYEYDFCTRVVETWSQSVRLGGPGMNELSNE
jgi:hypothetical protein